MPKERDEDSGRFTRSAPNEDVLEFLRENDGGATNEVAEHFGWQRTTAYRRLTELQEEGRVKNRNVGGSLLWMLDEEG